TEPGPRGGSRLRGDASGLRAPALVVALLDDLRVRGRGDDRADLDLLVRLHRGLLAAAVRLAPDDLDLGADRHVGVNGRERKARALVGRVPGEHRKADDL